MSGTEPRFPDAALELLEFPSVLRWIEEYVQTPAGRRELHAVRPARDPGELAARRTRGNEALAALLGGRAPALGRCADVSDLLGHAARRPLEPQELLALAAALERWVALQAWSRWHPEYPALGAALAAAGDFGELRASLERLLDERGHVRDDADPGLERLRQRIRDLEARRARVLEEVAEEWHRRGWLRHRHPVRRGDRATLAVRAPVASRAPGVLHDRSHSGETAFVEPARAVLVSNELDDERARERMVVHRLLAGATRAVLREADSLRAAEAGLGRVDLACGAAAWGRETGACYPEMEGGLGGIELRGARHPLLQREIGRERVVPLDLTLGRDHDLLVVTGPNTGGKTVALKTLGLLCALACAGLPVTAESGTRVPLLAGIEADIGDPQSIQSSLSTFSGHVRRILGILERARQGTLVLVDELGTGTDPEEGAALGQAILEALLRRGALVLATTHLGALKLFSLQVPRAENASMEFDPVSLAPSYRLLVGVPGASHALEVAERLGLGVEILARARSLGRRDSRAEALIAEAALARRDAELLREQARRSAMAALETRRRADEEESAAGARRELREREAETEFRELRARLEGLLTGPGERLLGRLRGQERESAGELLCELRRILAEHRLGARWEAFVRSLRKGDVVYVPRYRQRLVVTRVDRRRGCVRVRSDRLEIEVPLRDVTWVEPPPGGEPA